MDESMMRGIHHAARRPSITTNTSSRETLRSLRCGALSQQRSGTLVQGQHRVRKHMASEAVLLERSLAHLHIYGGKPKVSAQARTQPPEPTVNEQAYCPIAADATSRPDFAGSSALTVVSIQMLASCVTPVPAAGGAAAACAPPPLVLRLRRRAMLSRRRAGLVAPPMVTGADAPGVPGSAEVAAGCPWSLETAGAATGPVDLAPGPATDAGDAAAESPGTADRRAMSARTALNPLISSSSLGAQRSSVRFVVTILNVCLPASPVSRPSTCSGWRGGESGGLMELCRGVGKSYSKASSICARGMER